MPVLIALAFRETRLFWGVVLFTLLVALGLSIRFLLERLRLLLVPRLSAVLIVVVLLMLFISLMSHRLGMETGLSVALFPMVIIAMTIERMSVVWEERGPVDAIRAGLGSITIAVIAYLAMGMAWLEHLIFTFPELLLVVLAVVVLFGRYTGYRLTELRRFKALGSN
ncbi:MAG: 7TM domain-containing protein, partial [Woeseiaceae bacterium]